MKEEQRIPLPPLFLERMKQLLGEEYPEFIDSYEKERVQGLRLNPWKTGWMTEEDRAAWKEQFGLEEIPWVKNGFYYDRDTRPGKHPLHEAGAYYIQEPSAMSVAELLDARPGERILDLCAAPGGKSTQAAAGLQQQGLLVSNEIHPARAKILSQNVERMGIANAVVTNEDSSKLTGYFPEYFHKIVVDAPCSGEGMFRKDELARQEWSPEHVVHCAERQAEILDNAARMLKPGGRLVYSTCTFAPEENEEGIARFLKRHPEFEIEDMSQETGTVPFSAGQPQWAEDGSEALAKTFRIWPHKAEGEGHYLAVLHKQESESVTEERQEPDKKKKKKKSAEADNREVLEIWRTFAKETLQVGEDPILNGSTIRMFGEECYMVPPEMVDMRGLKVLRAGLDLGSVKKNRFEPSHALALYLNREMAGQWVSMPKDGDLILRYLRGETIDLEQLKSEHTASVCERNGWVLILVDGCSIGWAKLVGSTLKNHYPKGLRRP